MSIQNSTYIQIGYPSDPPPKESPLQVVAEILKLVHQSAKTERSGQCDEATKPVAGDYDPEHQIQAQEKNKDAKRSSISFGLDWIKNWVLEIEIRANDYQGLLERWRDRADFKLKGQVRKLTPDNHFPFFVWWENENAN